MGINGVNEPFCLNSNGNGYFTGNVGIGTTAPGAKLDVEGNLRATYEHYNCSWYQGDECNYTYVVGGTCPAGKFLAGFKACPSTTPGYYTQMYCCGK